MRPIGVGTTRQRAQNKNKVDFNNDWRIKVKQQIIIKCDSAIANAIMAMLATIITMNPEAGVDIETKFVSATARKVAPPRNCYRVVDVANAAAAMTGMAPMRAVIFGHLLTGTIRAADQNDRKALMSKADVVIAGHDGANLIASTVEREIGQLLNKGLIVSEPIVVESDQ